MGLGGGTIPNVSLMGFSFIIESVHDTNVKAYDFLAEVLQAAEYRSLDSANGLDWSLVALRYWTKFYKSCFYSPVLYQNDPRSHKEERRPQRRKQTNPK